MQIDATLIPRERIAERVREMGAQITSDLEEAGGEPVTFIPVLTGALVFAADLVREIPRKLSIRPVTASSYLGGMTSTGSVDLRGDLPTDLGGKHVIIVDDILDSGRTLGLLRRVVAAQRPASLRVAVLLSKSKAEGRHEEVEVEYVGFEIEDHFVVGYGLDYEGFFRNHPDIALLSVPDAMVGEDLA